MLRAYEYQFLFKFGERGLSAQDFDGECEGQGSDEEMIFYVGVDGAAGCALCWCFKAVDVSYRNQMTNVKDNKAMPNMFSAPVWTCPERRFWPTTIAWAFAAGV